VQQPRQDAARTPPTDYHILAAAEPSFHHDCLLCSDHLWELHSSKWHACLLAFNLAVLTQIDSQILVAS
jgi:hypothetical protein